MELNTQYARKLKRSMGIVGQQEEARRQVNSYLYQKYASSQNYYYTKDLNDVLTDTRSAAAFVVKDFAQYDTVD